MPTISSTIGSPKTEKNISIVVLRELGHPEIPKHLIVQEFGSEIIVGDRGERQAVGTSFYLSGPVSDLRAWVKKAGGKIWTSNNPMAGHWTQATISDE